MEVLAGEIEHQKGSWACADHGADWKDADEQTVDAWIAGELAPDLNGSKCTVWRADGVKEERAVR